MTTNTTDELPSSKLGTQEYWNDFYSKELQNFEDNKDEGEIWFGHTHMMKVVNWILANTFIGKQSNILDIGCGNGAFLLELADEEYANLFGLDYSATAVGLARNIAEGRKLTISYAQADFLSTSATIFHDDAGIPMRYHVCHDKGTYDAISLRPDDSELAREQYIKTLDNILEDGGLFVITSCNWTLEELKVHFSGFKFLNQIKAPTFQFGGQTGSTVSTAIFEKSKCSR